VDEVIAVAGWDGDSSLAKREQQWRGYQWVNRFWNYGLLRDERE